MKRSRNESLRWLGVAVDLINSEFSHDLGLGKIATQVGVHPAYLSRIFRRVHRESVGHYLNRLRVRYAGVELAKDPSIPLCEVALAAGFADQSQFTKIFKQISGITPGAFRNSVRCQSSRCQRQYAGDFHRGYSKSDGFTTSLPPDKRS
jgi:AraC-like DNA-binding protein